jgi:hypothetical protein
MLWTFGLVAVAGLMMTGVMIGMSGQRGAPADCTVQRHPAEPRFPRLTCAEARAELDRVARGEASPRTIVLRPMQLAIDAKDVTGPATLRCDGIDLAMVDANQADPTGPIVFLSGPHAVLATVLPDGRLYRPQYSICSNVVAGERRGELR